MVALEAVEAKRRAAYYGKPEEYEPFFAPEEVTKWQEEIDDVEHPERHTDRTGICPHCGDALILGDGSGYKITDTFLEAMRMR